MKIDELMIGDWVRIGNIIAQITGLKKVSNEQQFFSVYYYHTEDKTEEGCFIDEIEPIPLTKDILEKNGFEVHRQFATFTEYWLDIPRKWVRVAPNSYIEIYNGENKNVHIDGKSYVHELQHALRLCEIDKEIVL